MKLEYKVIDNKFTNVKEVLKAYFNISDRLLIKLKKNEKILLNNTPIYINKLISIGDFIEIYLDFEEESKNIVPIEMNLDIVFEDNSLLILNKPAGIPVHPSMSHYKNSISNGVKFYYDTKKIKKKIRPVNRLDKDTSGLVVFAKNEYIQENLIQQMKNKTFKKEYLAILEGHLEKASGTINAPISRKETSIIEREINPNGDISITNYEVIKNFNSIPKFCLVKFSLETGRTHQIRVHSKYINHPILGDSLYGNSSSLISRQALHAYKISFNHPITNIPIVLEIDLPEDIKNIIIK